MTNTLHRAGTRENLANDIIVFAIAARGVHAPDAAVAKLRQFLRMACRHNPVSIGDATKGSVFRAQRGLTPAVHWRRRQRADFEAVVNGVDAPTTVAAVFEKANAVEALLNDLKAADLGLCVNISSLTDRAQDCCRAAGLVRHSVEYSLGFRGRTERLPEMRALELCTMCGHGMVSAGLAHKMIEWVRTARRTPEETARYLSRFCCCGIFNLARATELLECCRRPSEASK